MRCIGMMAAAVVVTSIFAGTARAGADVARVSFTLAGHRLSLGAIGEGDRKSVKDGPVELEGHADAMGLHLKLSTPGPDIYADLHAGNLRVRVHLLVDLVDKTFSVRSRHVVECVKVPGIGDCCIDIEFVGR